MKKHILLSCVVAIGVLGAVEANAYIKRGYAPPTTRAKYDKYISGNFVLSPSYSIKDDYVSEKLGAPVGVTLGVGVIFNKARIELAAKYLTDASFKQEYYIDPYFVEEKINFDNVNLMLNVYYDINLSNRFAIFMGMGAGYLHSFISAKAMLQDMYYNRQFINETMDDGAFAYQFIAGVSYDVSQNTTFDVQYRFNGSAGIIDDSKFYGHEILLGARFNF